MATINELTDARMLGLLALKKFPQLFKLRPTLQVKALIFKAMAKNKKRNYKSKATQKFLTENLMPYKVGNSYGLIKSCFEKNGVSFEYAELTHVELEDNAYFVGIEYRKGQELIQIFTQHFIHRFRQRMGIEDGDNIKAIMTFLQSTLNFYSVDELNNKGDLKVGYECGHGLGFCASLPNGREVQFMKTFVDVDLLREDQKKIHPDEKERPPNSGGRLP